MKNKFLIILIVIILLLAGGLGYYTYFMYEKNEVVKENDINKADATAILDGFYYQMLLHMKNMEAKDISDDDILYLGYYGLNDNEVSSNTDDNVNCTELLEIPDTAKCMAMDLGLSDEKVNEMDTTLWTTMFSGSTAFEMFSKESLESEITKRYGINKEYDESFIKSTDLSCGSLVFIYDNAINMFFTHVCSGCTVEQKKPYAVVIDGYKDGDYYKINVVNAIVDSFLIENKLYFNISAESDPENIIIKDASSEGTEEFDNLFIQNKNKLDNYTLTFKKIGNSYQFVRVDYVK